LGFDPEAFYRLPKECRHPSGRHREPRSGVAIQACGCGFWDVWDWIAFPGFAGLAMTVGVAKRDRRDAPVAAD
jgi:hypothetical protein